MRERQSGGVHIGGVLADAAPFYATEPVMDWLVVSLHLGGEADIVRLPRQRRLLVSAAEHHGLFDPVEPVVDGVGEIVLPHIPRPLGAGFR